MSDDFDILLDARPNLRAAMKIQTNSKRHLARAEDSCKAALADLERALESLESARAEIDISLEKYVAAAADVDAAPIHAKICVPAWDAAWAVQNAALAEIDARNFALAARDCAVSVRELVGDADESLHSFRIARKQAERAHLAARKESDESLAAFGRDQEVCSLTPESSCRPSLDCTSGFDESTVVEMKLKQATKASTDWARKKAVLTSREHAPAAALTFEKALSQLAEALVREAHSRTAADASEIRSLGTLLEETAAVLRMLPINKWKGMFPLDTSVEGFTVLAKLTASSSVALENTIDGHWEFGFVDCDTLVPARNTIRELRSALETLEPKLGP